MLHLLQPIWLLASGAIVVPVAIHLWNVRKGKVLRVGSVELLTEAAQQRARSLRLTEWFLLLLRCLLILLFSLLMAKPYWQKKTSGWIVVQKQMASRIVHSYKDLIDSLKRAGYQTYWFQEDFAEADLTDIPVDDTAELPSYWQLVKKMEQHVPAGDPVYLFTDNLLRHFKGTKPEIHFPLTWKVVSTDSTVRFIDHAYVGDNDSLFVVTGASSAAGTSYQTQVMAANRPGKNGLTIDAENGRMRVRWKNEEPALVDTAALDVLIYAGEYPADAQYVKAALQSIQQVTHRQIHTRSISLAQDAPLQADWLFWLSDEKIPASIHAKHVLAYAGGKTNAVNSVIQTRSGKGRIGIQKRRSFDGAPGATLWQDGYGEPLLVNDGERYRLYTHFDPSWNELVWSGSFPQSLYQLTGARNDSTKNDFRSIDAGALAFPAQPFLKKPLIENLPSDHTAHRVIWIVLMLVWVTERSVSFRAKKRMAHA